MKTMMTGIHELTDTDYRALSAINKSGLDQINKSPAHYQAYLRQPQEPTAAMILGTATHYGVFQPELFYRHFFARPDGIDGRTKEGKAQLSELGKANAGKTMLSLEDFQTVEAMMKAVRNHPTASQLISGGKAEMSALCQDPELGVLCKARPDYLGTNGIIVDLKTTDDASFFAFQRKVRSFRYHVQAAWYLDTVNAAMGGQYYNRFILLVIEKEAPHGIILYELDSEAIRLGKLEARANLKTYAECLKKNEWPSYPEHLLTMTVPVYE